MPNHPDFTDWWHNQEYPDYPLLDVSLSGQGNMSDAINEYNDLFNPTQNYSQINTPPNAPEPYNQGGGSLTNNYGELGSSNIGGNMDSHYNPNNPSGVGLQMPDFLNTVQTGQNLYNAYNTGSSLMSTGMSAPNPWLFAANIGLGAVQGYSAYRGAEAAREGLGVTIEGLEGRGNELRDYINKMYKRQDSYDTEAKRYDIGKDLWTKTVQQAQSPYAVAGTQTIQGMRGQGVSSVEILQSKLKEIVGKGREVVPGVTTALLKQGNYLRGLAAGMEDFISRGREIRGSVLNQLYQARGMRAGIDPLASGLDAFTSSLTSWVPFMDGGD